MKKTLLSLLCLAVLVLPQAAQAQIQAFDWLGQVDLPDAVGGDLSMYSILADGAPAVVPPFAMDWDNFEYTLVVTGLELLVDGSQQSYGNGVIALYEDNGTAADYANLGTFTDGTAILTGVVVSLTRTVTALPFPPFTGVSVSGTVDWTGGSRVGEFAPEDLDDWTFVAGGNTDAADIEPGFDEQWDGKVEPKEPVVGTEESTVGGLKVQFSH